MKLTDAFLARYKTVTPPWGFGVLGWVVYKRTYARPLPNGETEEWWQTVQRVVEGVYSVQHDHCTKNGLPWNSNKAQASAQKMYDLIFNFKFLPPGRGLWAMGTQYIKERGSAPLNNCAFITTADIKQDFSYPFCWLMDMSMLGVGVGSDTRGAGTMVIKNPHIDDAEESIFVVEDSREGWVDSVRVLLDAYAGKGTLPTRFDYSKVRPSGVPLKGFGGISSGPQPLIDLHRSLITLLDGNVGREVTSSLIVDIFNLVGKAVVSGGIRRTAEIILGDVDDDEFIKLKDPTLYPDELVSHRWASNNSVIAIPGTDYDRFIPQIMSNGEPGFFWLDNARSYGRMKEPAGKHDPFVLGQNPCGEISLESGEFCNLVEVFPAHHDSYEELKHTLKFAYLYAKSVSLMPTHSPQTNAVIGRNRRVGVSVSGVTQAIQKHGLRTFFTYLDKGYAYLRELDEMYSRWLCVPKSIKLTTVKPSGTVSLVAGSTPGVHFPHSEYYIRNVRFDPHSPLLKELQDAGYPVEPSVMRDNTYVVSFPIHEKHFMKGKSDVTMWEQFELAAQMQHWWADNSVSVTVTVRPEETKDLAQALRLYETRLKSVSVLPHMDVGKYPQMPYIQISKQQYELLVSKIKPLANVYVEHDVDETGCTTDTCSIL